jgi:hypothetical protein
MSKINFDELNEMIVRFNSNIPKIKRAYWRARVAWQEAKPALKKLRENPAEKVNPHHDIGWFLTYRDEARGYRKDNEAIKAKIESILNGVQVIEKPKGKKTTKKEASKACDISCAKTCKKGCC